MWNPYALRILVGSGITLFALLFMAAFYARLTQPKWVLQILREDATLNGLVKATLEITQSPIIANAVKTFSTLALVTSFLGVALGLLECIEDLLKQSFDIHAGRISLGLMTLYSPQCFSPFSILKVYSRSGLCWSNVCVLRSGFTGSISLESTLNSSKLAISGMGR